MMHYYVIMQLWNSLSYQYLFDNKIWETFAKFKKNSSKNRRLQKEIYQRLPINTNQSRNTLNIGNTVCISGLNDKYNAF